jgi:HEAT repeats
MPAKFRLQNSCGSLLCVVFGVVALTGCNGSTSIDISKLPPPVNVALPVTAGESTQIAAADALGRIGGPAVPALADALTDPNAVVRLQACKALAYMGAKASPAVPELVQRLYDSEEAVRMQAANALGQIGEESRPAVPQLVEMLKGQTRQTINDRR